MYVHLLERMPFLYSSLIRHVPFVFSKCSFHGFISGLLRRPICEGSRVRLPVPLTWEKRVYGDSSRREIGVPNKQVGDASLIQERAVNSIYSHKTDRFTYTVRTEKSG